jgi:hypothetical protein
MLGVDAGGWAAALSAGAPPFGGSEETDCACAAKAVAASNPMLNTVDFNMLGISAISSSSDDLGGAYVGAADRSYK